MFVCVIMSERMTLWLHPHIVLCCVCVLKAFFIKKKQVHKLQKSVFWFGCVEIGTRFSGG